MTRLNNERLTTEDTRDGMRSYIKHRHLITNKEDEDLILEELFSLERHIEALAIRVAQAEAERDVLITALGAGVSDCPYLTFWDDGADLEIPDWCTCSDTDEYGFECNVDAKDCWLKYAQQQAEKKGA